MKNSSTCSLLFTKPISLRPNPIATSYFHKLSLNLGAVRLATLFFMSNETEPVALERYALVQGHIRDAALRSL